MALKSKKTHKNQLNKKLPDSTSKKKRIKKDRIVYCHFLLSLNRTLLTKNFYHPQLQRPVAVGTPIFCLKCKQQANNHGRSALMPELRNSISSSKPQQLIPLGNSSNYRSFSGSTNFFYKWRLIQLLGNHQPLWNLNSSKFSGDSMLDQRRNVQLALRKPRFSKTQKAKFLQIHSEGPQMRYGYSLYNGLDLKSNIEAFDLMFVGANLYWIIVRGESCIVIKINIWEGWKRNNHPWFIYNVVSGFIFQEICNWKGQGFAAVLNNCTGCFCCEVPSRQIYLFQE